LRPDDSAKAIILDAGFFGINSHLTALFNIVRRQAISRFTVAPLRDFLALVGDSFRCVFE